MLLNGGLVEPPRAADRRHQMTSRYRFVGASAVILLAGALVAGCSSGGGSGTTTSSAAGSGSATSSASCASSAGSLTIGATNDLSGPLSGLGGLGQAAGLQAAVDAANKAGGVACKQLKLVSLDDANVTSRAIGNITQLTTQNGAVAVTGFTASAACLAAQKPLETANTAQICSSGDTSVFGSPPAKNTFLSQVLSADLAKPSIQAISGLITATSPKIAIVGFSTPSSLPMLAATKTAAEAKGWTVVANLTVPATTTTMDTQVSAVLAAHPDAIVLNMSDAQVIQLIRGVRAGGMNVPIIATQGATSATLNTLKDSNYYLESGYALAGAAYDSFASSMKAAGLDPAIAGGIYGYVEGLTLIGALKACGGCSGQAVIDSLNKLKLPTNGVTASPIEFSADDHVGLSAISVYKYGANGIAATGDSVPTGRR
jgi:branched-chain amino acid transport system substrate-binding protein